MNRDDIIRMAQEAGAFFDGDFSVYDMPEHCFEKFAALVAAAEREACCKIVYGLCESDNVAQRTVNAIRARGQENKS
jgi:hypothetical protein